MPLHLELTEWEKEVRRFSDACARRPNYVPSDGDIRTWASELLTLALKELKPEIDAEIAKAYMNADEVMYRKGKEEALKEIIKSLFPLETDILTLDDLNTVIQNNNVGCYNHGFEEGKKVALKDLPRWEKDGIPVGSAAVDISGLGGFDFIRRNGKLLRISSLEKIPGFKEDDHE